MIKKLKSLKSPKLRWSWGQRRTALYFPQWGRACSQEVSVFSEGSIPHPYAGLGARSHGINNLLTSHTKCDLLIWENKIRKLVLPLIYPLTLENSLSLLWVYEKMECIILALFPSWGANEVTRVPHICCSTFCIQSYFIASSPQLYVVSIIMPVLQDMKLRCRRVK